MESEKFAKNDRAQFSFAAALTHTLHLHRSSSANRHPRFPRITSKLLKQRHCGVNFVRPAIVNSPAIAPTHCSPGHSDDGQKYEGARMGNAIRRLDPAPEATGQTRRKSFRIPAQAVAQLGSLDGEIIPVVIGDLSTHGCFVRSTSGWLRVGRFVSVSLGDDPPLRAIVRWVREEAAGLEFLRPIPMERSEWHALMRHI